LTKLKRDGVCDPVTHVFKAIEVIKRFGRVLAPSHKESIMMGFGYRLYPSYSLIEINDKMVYRTALLH
jgi:hypothetical protein